MYRRHSFPKQIMANSYANMYSELRQQAIITFALYPDGLSPSCQVHFAYLLQSCAQMPISPELLNPGVSFPRIRSRKRSLRNVDYLRRSQLKQEVNGELSDMEIVSILYNLKGEGGRTGAEMTIHMHMHRPVKIEPSSQLSLIPNVEYLLGVVSQRNA